MTGPPDQSQPAREAHNDNQRVVLQSWRPACTARGMPDREFNIHLIFGVAGRARCTGRGQGARDKGGGGRGKIRTSRRHGPQRHGQREAHTSDSDRHHRRAISLTASDRPFPSQNGSHDQSPGVVEHPKISIYAVLCTRAVQTVLRCCIYRTARRA